MKDIYFKECLLNKILIIPNYLLVVYHNKVEKTTATFNLTNLHNAVET